MERQRQWYYLFCNHWTQGGIGLAFPSGWMNGKKYERTFSSVYTIHQMLDAADQFPGLKVSMELDSYLFEEVLKEDPACIERLRQYIREGKAGIDGGTYAQPFGQDYGWEPNIRQLTYGRQAVKDVLDYDVKAFLVEEQWFHPQLPQLLLQAGYRYASLQNQNSGQVSPMKETMIEWVGLDGSKLPTVPANDLMVSCVRQYTDYSEYEERWRDYDNPLLFQWVEVWVPGMDWGASCTPFARAIHQVLREWNAKSVTLADYFELETPRRRLKPVYIPLDESNYANNWYQYGGWGYDGDRVIMADKRAEQRLLALETWAALRSLQGLDAPSAQSLRDVWKKFLTLQNHDYSVARNYRAYTEDGVRSEAGSLAVAEYNRLAARAESQIEQLVAAVPADRQGDGALTVAHASGIPHRRTLELRLPAGDGERIVLRQDGRELACQETSREGGEVTVLTAVDLPAVGSVTLDVERQPADGEAAGGNTAAAGIVQSQAGDDVLLEDDQVRVEWISGTWKARVLHKPSGKSVTFTAFTGPIAKVNEHDANVYPALSPAHEVFSFAFDGTTHSPDQVTRPKAEIEEAGPVQSTLRIFSNVLTLHTTPVPVAFAEARVRIHHLTGRIDCESHLYTGVWLKVHCWAEFAHDLEEARYVRDFPFGEEETRIDWIYPNTYTRATGGDAGFTLVHPGVQRVNLRRASDGGTIRHLLARDNVIGDYRWSFSLFFGCHQPWESAALARSVSAHAAVVEGGRETVSHYACADPRILLSALYREEDKCLLRLVNYSADETGEVAIDLNHPFSGAALSDFLGNEREPVDCLQQDGKTRLTLSFKPWQIVTLVLKP